MKNAPDRYRTSQPPVARTPVKSDRGDLSATVDFLEDVLAEMRANEEAPWAREIRVWGRVLGPLG